MQMKMHLNGRNDGGPSFLITFVIPPMQFKQGECCWGTVVNIRITGVRRSSGRVTF